MITLNGLSVVSARVFTPYTGAWVAEVDLDLTAVPAVPSGTAVLTLDTSILRGTIETSGKFGEKARLRIVGGAGGWHRNVSARHFHNDAGLLSSAVLAATAAEIGESAVDVLPTLLGVDYVRTAGPASRVLAGRDWYVTPEGVTTVGPRVQLPFDSTAVDILEWDPHQQRAELAADAPVSPGTILVDLRFGSAVVRDVEQTWTGEGKARATVWCGPSKATRLAGALTRFVEAKSKDVFARIYRYRVVLQGGDGRLTLQAVSKTPGVPDAVAIDIWPGVPGAKVHPVLGTLCLVAFADGEPARPVVIGFEEGGGTSPVALAALVTAQLTALKAAIVAAPITPLDGGLAFKTALVAALSSWPSTVASTALSSD